MIRARSGKDRSAFQLKTDSGFVTQIVRILLAATVVCFAACKEAPPETRTAKNEAEVTYQVKGVLRSAPDFTEESVMIEHADIPGFMPAMTMPFEFREPEQLKGLDAGDPVAFEFVVTETDSWIKKVRKVDRSEVVLPERKAVEEPGPTVARVKEGQRVPEFKLVDQAGRPVSNETFAGKPLVVTFMFTRCPVPNFCPLMSKNFQTLEQKIQEDPQLAGKVNLLSISFDEYDKPEVLAEYGKQWTKDLDSWRFATGEPDEIRKLTQAFAVQVKPESGTINHGLATALIGPDGTIHRIWRGNAWKTEEVFNALREMKPGERAGLSQHRTNS